MYGDGIGQIIKIRKLENIIYKLKNNLELDEKETAIVQKILESKKTTPQ